MIKVEVPATTANLGPGFDTLGMSLELYNEVEVAEIEEGLEIEVVGYGSDELTTDKSNLIYQSMERVFTKVGYSPQGLKIKLKNRIPLARGLGSSAAAIVGGLVAANKLAGEKLSIDQLVDLATEIEGHPDNVAPALLGGVVISTVKGSKVVYKKLAVPAKLKTVVCIPDYQLSTAKAREVLPAEVSFKDAVFNLSHTGLLLTGLLTEDYTLIKEALDDKLHQPYRQDLVPGLAEILKEVKSDALGVTISGSGPTVIAFTLENEGKIGKKMVDIFAEHGLDSHYMITHPTNQGVIILED
ncbi:homoserine kinase [Orenia metallireducens]|jgi:homoserine kinase|uniref:Homoserine kinase n=1 Tax=Orenia metallireducens TaxID=1413210 RepID=A0A285GF88_9FIRM|nr:homoserine kinase [Orenia metallireducens]PRX30392.1 homoserine kinase [Orenia metallireducens]SNY22250.1 homoserine kinase [Orenia metallireducens]